MIEATNSIIAFHRPEQIQAAEREKTLNALKFRMAESMLRHLLKNKEISKREYEQGRELLTRRFKQERLI